jgi:pimeloyl-ACP methyl ester carboxylesterase
MRTSDRWRWVVGALLLVVLAFTTIAFLAPDWLLRTEFARERWRAGLVERTLQAAGHRWAYVDAGAGPVLLLVHGYTGSKENWVPLAGELKSRFHVIAPDLPGWGESERQPGADYGYVAQSERLAEFIRVIGGGRPVALVGHSMGGGIAALTAARHPELVSKLVLMDASGVQFRDNAFGLAVQRGEQPFAVATPAGLRHYLHTVFAEPPWVPWPIDTALVARRRRDAGFERDVLRAISGPDAFLPGREADAIRAPTLLLWCSADRVIDVSAATLYAARISRAHTLLMDGCNHMPMMERTNATANALVEFLR